uniref:Uncharacterized protein n=1 Tax=Arundo donax TaxID=35708 RepID=A0A0A9HH28_ARUDO
MLCWSNHVIGFSPYLSFQFFCELFPAKPSRL